MYLCYFNQKQFEARLIHLFFQDFYFAKEIKEESSNPLFLIPLYEASQYNFSLKIVSNEVPDVLKVWSEPYKKNYLTGNLLKICFFITVFVCIFVDKISKKVGHYISAINFIYIFFFK